MYNIIFLVCVILLVYLVYININTVESIKSNRKNKKKCTDVMIKRRTRKCNRKSLLSTRALCIDMIQNKCNPIKGKGEWDNLNNKDKINYCVLFERDIKKKICNRKKMKKNKYFCDNYNSNNYICSGVLHSKYNNPVCDKAIDDTKHQSETYINYHHLFNDTYQQIRGHLYDESTESSYIGFNFIGQQIKNMYDRRPPSGYYDTNAYTYQMGLGKNTKKVVNLYFNSNDFNKEDIGDIIKHHGTMLGRVPAFLLQNLHTIDFQGGRGWWGGGDNGMLLIHIDEEKSNYESTDAKIYDVLIHECTHVTMDHEHANSPGWIAARYQDCAEFSPYASKYPIREDFAETMGAYLAMRFRKEKLDSKYDKLETLLSARFKYLDNLNLSMKLLP
jgi:hypothetical protein